MSKRMCTAIFNHLCSKRNKVKIYLFFTGCQVAAGKSPLGEIPMFYVARKARMNDYILDFTTSTNKKEACNQVYRPHFDFMLFILQQQVSVYGSGSWEPVNTVDSSAALPLICPGNFRFHWIEAKCVSLPCPEHRVPEERVKRGARHLRPTTTDGLFSIKNECSIVSPGTKRRHILGPDSACTLTSGKDLYHLEFHRWPQFWVAMIPPAETHLLPG